MEKKTKEPMLYIHQPHFKMREIKMQEVYSAKNAKKQAAARQASDNHKKSKPAVQREESIFGPASHEADLPERNDDVQSAIRDYQDAQLEKKEEESRKQGFFSFQRVKPFKEMNVEERLDYLIHFPKQLPPVPCLVLTEEKTYRGIVQSMPSEDRVEIKLMDQSLETISVKSIKEIKMIGFTK
ncbi:spore coat CotO family protein [Bacillus infantis]|uniref:spore coat CotO family protein n=1 Tax=Bacillus infantis TaxID=324767 RepID=UPI0020A0D278|nr:spore coat CotO family protein [Bacillus infantis]